MSYLAQGINQGFQLGQRASQEKKRRLFEEEQAQKAAAERQADRDLQREVANRRLDNDALDYQFRKSVSDHQINSDRERRAAEAADPRNVLARTKAERELADLLNPKPKTFSPEEQLEADIRRMKLQQEHDSLTAPKAGPVAKVTRAFGEDGKSKAEYDVPLTDLERSLGGAGQAAYRSPYADQIADLGGRIAEQQSAIEGGDRRTGFLGIGSSRAAIADQAMRQRLRLQAMELQDMVMRGAITKEEADRRASLLMGGK